LEEKMKMKKFVVMLTAFIAINVLLPNCVTTPQPEPKQAAPAENTATAQQTESAGGKSLDQAIAEAAARIEERVRPGSKIALLNFNAPSDRFSAYVLDELSVYLVDSGSLTVVDRKEMDLIRSEMDFQFSGDVSENSMQALGQKIGAQSIVSGSLTDIGGDYRIMFRVLSVESAAILAQFRTDIVSSTRVKALLEGGKTATAASAQTNRQAAAPAQPVSYKVGDKGPAGGIVFYDKGNKSNGWQYLEAAPSDINRKLPGQTEHIGMLTEDRTVGSGRKNTDRMMEEARKSGGGFGWAAKACVDLTVNDFNDWYLPAWDELNFMYGNLHAQGLGGFRNDIYYSSTDTSAGWWLVNFSNGSRDYASWGQRECYVRPVRQF
jgi:TolB-like protein